MAKISVDVGVADLDIVEHWERLIERASPNVFMSPVALNAAHATEFAKIHVLLAWDESVRPRQLVGLWALQEQKGGPLRPSFLSAPPYRYAFVSNPVIDPAAVDDVVPALLATIESIRELPNVIRLACMDSDSSACVGVLRALAARGSQTLALSQTARPFASRELGVKRVGATRKKLRQDWNRLSALGPLDIVNERDREAVTSAFEVFLAMEFASWKGANGTALLCTDEDASFARRLVRDLAANEGASVALLRSGETAIAAQVLLYCGNMAYTWKTAFDRQFSRFSPGALLIDRMTEQLLATGAFEGIESCSPGGGFMAELWAGRRATLDVLVDVGTRHSANFAAAALWEHGYRHLRTMRDQARAIGLMGRPRNKAVPALR